MKRLTCPWCGPRAANEFHCGGAIGIVRPALDCSDDEWARYLFMRANPRGAHDERWRHSFGCGQWFAVRRDTVTHSVSAVWRFGEAAPT